MHCPAQRIWTASQSIPATYQKIEDHGDWSGIFSLHTPPYWIK
jgi:hypothetical protein